MKAKILDVNQAIWQDLIRDSDWNRMCIGTKNIFAPASMIQGLMFAPRSIRSEQGARMSGRMYDGTCEPNSDPKIFCLLDCQVSLG